MSDPGAEDGRGDVLKDQARADAADQGDGSQEPVRPVDDGEDQRSHDEPVGPERREQEQEQDGLLCHAPGIVGDQGLRLRVLAVGEPGPAHSLPVDDSDASEQDDGQEQIPAEALPVPDQEVPLGRGRSQDQAARAKPMAAYFMFLALLACRSPRPSRWRTGASGQRARPSGRSPDLLELLLRRRHRIRHDLADRRGGLEVAR